jgi:hypothetical protein
MECLLSGLVSYIVKNPEQPQVNTLRIDLSRFVCRRNSGARTMVEPTSAELVVHTGRHGEKTYETRLHSTKVHVSFTDLDFLTTLTRNWSNVLYRPDTRHPTTTAVEGGGGKGRKKGSGAGRPGPPRGGALHVFGGPFIVADCG